MTSFVEKRYDCVRHFQTGMSMTCFGMNYHISIIMFIIANFGLCCTSKTFDKNYDIFKMTVYNIHRDKEPNMTAFNDRQTSSEREKRETDIEKSMRRMRGKLDQVGLFIAAHKYLAMDARFKGRQFLQERTNFRHFPVPRLKNLHSALVEACGKGALSCLDGITIKASEYNQPRTRLNKFWPFFDELDLFRFRTTASYFLCHFTLQENLVMKSVYHGGRCLRHFNRKREVKESGVWIQDTRLDRQPFQCSKIFFCPDPCYGRKTSGQVPSYTPEKDDVGNPCRGLRHKKCDWAPGENSDFESLIRNRFNITCECEKERPGFTWSSRFRMCVDRDECWATSGLCGPDRICQNTVGSYECVCKRGKRLQASTETCVDIVPLKQAKHATSRVKKKNERPTILRRLEILFGVTSASELQILAPQLSIIVFLNLLINFICYTL